MYITVQKTPIMKITDSQSFTSYGEPIEVTTDKRVKHAAIKIARAMFGLGRAYADPRGVRKIGHRRLPATEMRYKFCDQQFSITAGNIFVDHLNQTFAENGIEAKAYCWEWRSGSRNYGNHICIRLTK